MKPANPNGPAEQSTQNTRIVLLRIPQGLGGAKRIGRNRACGIEADDDPRENEVSY